jgi:hypothetical protein
MVFQWTLADCFYERTDIPGTSGVKAGELVMLAGSRKHNLALPGDKTYTFITLQNKLAYHYKRDTVVIFGNVIKVSHGERATKSSATAMVANQHKHSL